VLCASRVSNLALNGNTSKLPKPFQLLHLYPPTHPIKHPQTPEYVEATRCPPISEDTTVALTGSGLGSVPGLANNVDVQLAMQRDHRARRGGVHGAGQQDLVLGGAQAHLLVVLRPLGVLSHHQLAVVPAFHAAGSTGGSALTVLRLCVTRGTGH